MDFMGENVLFVWCKFPFTHSEVLCDILQADILLKINVSWIYFAFNHSIQLHYMHVYIL